MSKEWKIGLHDAVYDEGNHALIVTLNGKFQAEDVREYSRVTNEVFVGMDDSGKNVMIDLSDPNSQLMDKDAREALKEEFERVSSSYVGKTAVVGAGSATRMMSKIITRLTGGDNNTRFFKTSDDAFQWFKEE